MRRLYRSRYNKMVAGVFGGIAEYFNISPTPIRLIALIIFIANPFMFTFIYFIAALSIPINPSTNEYYNDADDDYDYEVYEEEKSRKNNNTMAIALILAGAFLLLYKFVPGFTFNFLPAIRRAINKIVQFWPVLLIILGAYMLVKDE